MTSAINQIYPFTPVYSDEMPLLHHFAEYLSPLTCVQRAAEQVPGSRGCVEREYKPTAISTALKIITYIASLGILPLLAAIVLYAARSCADFHWQVDLVNSAEKMDPPLSTMAIEEEVNLLPPPTVEENNPPHIIDSETILHLRAVSEANGYCNMDRFQLETLRYESDSLDLTIEQEAAIRLELYVRKTSDCCFAEGHYDFNKTVFRCIGMISEIMLPNLSYYPDDYFLNIFSIFFNELKGSKVFSRYGDALKKATREEKVRP